MMKKSLLIIISLLFCCNSSNIHKTDLSNENTSNLITNCPEDGKCSFDVIRNTSMKVLTDEFGNSYSEFYESDAIVLKFEYKRNEIPNTADSGYREEIYIELNPENLEMDLKDKELKMVNLHFGRFCFCKGQTGIYEILKGRLSITKTSANQYLLNLEFETDEVPQVISKITEEFSLKKAF